MPVVVQKYGGSSVADLDRLRAVAQRIVATRENGYDVVVVVSAMGKTTDQLMAMAREASPEPGRRELDMLLSVGERIAMSLLSMVINDLGHKAISFTGSQCGIITDTRHVDARIVEVRPYRILKALEDGHIVIVAGYQGVSLEKEVTTLGRGGSDTTAIALAAALEAECCEICSDVDGVYSADPREVPGASRIPQLTYDEMLALSHAGAKVLNAEAVEYAKRHGVKIHALASFKNGGYTLISLSSAAEARAVAVTADRALAGFVLTGVAADDIVEGLELLARRGIATRMVQLSEVKNDGYRLTAWFGTSNVPDLGSLSEKAYRRWKDAFTLHVDIGSVSVIGAGVGESPAVLASALEIAREQDAAIHGAFQNHHGITLLVPLTRTGACVRALHGSLVGNSAVLETAKNRGAD